MEKQNYILIDKTKAITLIALVITIVVLIILATVVVNMTLGENGLFGRARVASQLYNNAQEYEKEQVGDATNSILVGNRDLSQNDIINLIKEYSTPVGTVISVMGNSAPDFYLPCDGQWYDVNGTYKPLAEYIYTQFGSYDYFKIGEEASQEGKFKIPDLRGEFLRGTGTNGHSNSGNGANVGIHQNGTKHSSIMGSYGGKWIGNYTNGLDNWTGESDSSIGSSTGAILSAAGSINTNEWTKNHAIYYTSRPSNTSVLYCIKYK